MRILPVTGDLPALATAPPAPVRSTTEPPPPVPVVAQVQHPSGAGTSTDTAKDHRHPASPKPFFDPPLIAQRAVLGLPTGYLIADFAESEGISYAAASAAVDRQMPRGAERAL